MRFCEASAKDNFNVDEIFLKLVDDILKKVKKNLHECFSSETYCLLFFGWGFIISKGKYSSFSQF